MTTNQKFGGSSKRDAAATKGSTYISTAVLMASLRLPICRALESLARSIDVIFAIGFAGHAVLYACANPGNRTCCGSTARARGRGGGGAMKLAAVSAHFSRRATPSAVPMAPYFTWDRPPSTGPYRKRPSRG